MPVRSRDHHYTTRLRWTGNSGSGTSGYRDYSRNHEIEVAGKPVIAGSSDPVFRGDPARLNPEDLLVASLSACHMLSYLHLCADAGIVVTDYTDAAVGHMREDDQGGGTFVRVVLRPQVTLADPARAQDADRLHHDAHQKCFIASSVKFPVEVEASIVAVKTL